MRRQYHGGQNARDWRRKVAALATDQKAERVKAEIDKSGMTCDKKEVVKDIDAFGNCIQDDPRISPGSYLTGLS